VINSDNAVVVNFHAEWCEPCKILTPKMTELLEDNPDIDLAVVDVDTNIEWVWSGSSDGNNLIDNSLLPFRLVNLFEVKAVPAVLAFRNGVVVDKFIGLVDANMIEDLISNLTRKKKVEWSWGEDSVRAQRAGGWIVRWILTVYCLIYGVADDNYAKKMFRDKVMIVIRWDEPYLLSWEVKNRVDLVGGKWKGDWEVCCESFVGVWVEALEEKLSGTWVGLRRNLITIIKEVRWIIEKLLSSFCSEALWMDKGEGLVVED
jgi:thiol-disulfide isomerase/thioredoxin